MATVNAIAECLGLTPRRVQQLVKEGVLPRDAKGHYSLIECVRAYAVFQRSRIKSLAAGGKGRGRKRFFFPLPESSDRNTQATIEGGSSENKLDQALSEIFERLAAARSKKR